MAAGIRKIEPPKPKRPVDRLIGPFRRFTTMQASGGILLLICTAIALAWANSPWADSYDHFWHLDVSVGFGTFAISKSLSHWVNDWLMAVFFFLVGLEIKREIIAGELASMRKAAIPIAAAVGGMVVPSAIYAALNFSGPGAPGWAIPAATDIAFALGIMALAGSRVPVGLKVFLTALAIVDDIGAVAIIAFFYTDDLSLLALGVGGGALAVMVAFNLLHVRSPYPYLILGAVLWVAFLKSGVHATLAGVLAAFTIPAKQHIDQAKFIAFSRRAVDRFEEIERDEQAGMLANTEREAWVHGLEQACEAVQTPLQRIEFGLHPWVSLFIMPVFALANAGVALGGNVMDSVTSRVGLGVILGLVLGKQIGVTLATFLAVKFGIGTLPKGTNMFQIYAAAWLAGIGFTMSLFIANLGFASAELLQQAKIGILAASLVAGVIGFLLLRAACRTAPPVPPTEEPSDPTDRIA